MNRLIAATALTVTTMAVAFTAAAAGPAVRASALGRPGGPPGGASVTLPGSVAPFTASGHVTGTVPAGSRLTIQFWLTPRTAAAERYATAVSKPGSGQFGHYLSPAAYAARFGATTATAAAVMSWLRTAGFSGVSDDLYRDYVQATAPVSVIDAALRLHVNYYRARGAASAGRYALRANDRPVSLPASLAGDILGITGLVNTEPTMTYARPGGLTGITRPKRRAAGPVFPCSQWYRQYITGPLPRLYEATRFSTVICGYTPQQLRRAYGYSSASSGKGVTVALVEVGLAGDMFGTLQMYAKVHGIQAPSPQRYAELALGKGSSCGDPFDVEEQLDVEASYDLAPGANQLVVGGDSCNNGFFGYQALYDADLAVLNGIGNRPLAQIASNSWEVNDEAAIPANMMAIQHSYLVRAAAEGVSMLFSTGDFSGVESPSSDPYATAVGGTTLGIGHDNPRLFETGWSTGISAVSKGRWVFQGEAGAAGGGASLLWKQPGYQRGVVPNSLAETDGDRGGLVRAEPDISAVADPYTAMAVGLTTLSQGVVTQYFEEPIGGTSLSTPLVAAIVADAEQGRGAFGFLNPAIYRLVGSSALNDPGPLSYQTPSKYRGVACDADMCGILLLTASDDQSWSMQGYTGQVTAPGYDTMTGVGTPNGQKFIAALRRIEG